MESLCARCLDIDCVEKAEVFLAAFNAVVEAAGVSASLETYKIGRLCQPKLHLPESLVVRERIKSETASYLRSLASSSQALTEEDESELLAKLDFDDDDELLESESGGTDGDEDDADDADDAKDIIDDDENDEDDDDEDDDDGDQKITNRDDDGGGEAVASPVGERQLTSQDY